MLGLRLLPPSLRTAAALSIARDGDADAAREAVAAFAAFWGARSTLLYVYVYVPTSSAGGLFNVAACVVVLCP